MPVQFPYRRICIIGGSASGKSTLSNTLAKRLGATHIELDALFHGPNWQPAEPEIFRARVREALRQESWICDGNYLAFSGEQLREADLVIWLNYPFRIVFTRVLRRTFKRLINKEVLWNGNREQWQTTFFSKESIIWWVITTHRLQKQRLPGAIAGSTAPSIVFRHPREAQAWLTKLN